jgi:hypothetical protein
MQTGFWKVNGFGCFALTRLKGMHPIEPRAAGIGSIGIFITQWRTVS